MLPTASIVLVGECAVSHLPFSGIPLPFSPAFQWHSTAFSPCLSLAFHCRFPPAFSLAFHCLFAALHRHFSAFSLPFIGISVPFCCLSLAFHCLFAGLQHVSSILPTASVRHGIRSLPHCSPHSNDSTLLAPQPPAPNGPALSALRRAVPTTLFWCPLFPQQTPPPPPLSENAAPRQHWRRQVDASKCAARRVRGAADEPDAIPMDNPYCSRKLTRVRLRCQGAADQRDAGVHRGHHRALSSRCPRLCCKTLPFCCASTGCHLFKRPSTVLPLAVISSKARLSVPQGTVEFISRTEWESELEVRTAAHPARRVISGLVCGVQSPRESVRGAVRTCSAT